MASSAPSPRPPAEESDRTLASADSAAERWRAALAANSQPDLAAFLPPRTDAARQSILLTLIGIELETRIARNEVCRIEDFANHLGELRPDDLLKLIVTELTARRARGEKVRRRDYRERFPKQFPRLMALTSSRGSTESRSALVRPKSLTTGQRIGDYEILRLLGSGSFADVYLARQRSLDREVALKVTRDRRHEAQTLAKLDHPNIVQVFSEHEAAGHQFLVMRYVPARTMDEWLEYCQRNEQDDSARQAPPWNGEELLAWLQPDGQTADRSDERVDELFQYDQSHAAARIFIELARALGHAHKRGVLHLDIKPSNILLDQHASALLMDFNVAAHHGTAHSSGSTADSAADAVPSGGTLAYMPPEQLRYFTGTTDDATAKQPLDARADLFSLGVVMYELITGRSPWPVPDEVGRLPAQQMLARRMRRATPLRSACKRADRNLAKIVDCLLDPDPVDRYPDADSLVADLRRWFDGKRILTAKPHPSQQTSHARLHPVRLSLAAGLLLVAGTLFTTGTNPFAIPSTTADSDTAGSDTATSGSQVVAVASTGTPPIQVSDEKDPDPDPDPDSPDSPPTDKLASDDNREESLDDNANSTVRRRTRMRPVVEILRNQRRTPLHMQIRKATAADIDNWALAINPLTLHGVDVPDNWQRMYRRAWQDNDEVRDVVFDVITEVVLVQLVVHGDEDLDQEDRFFRRVPREYGSLPLVRTLEQRLATASISEVSTSSLLATAENEFEHYLLGVVAAVRDEHETALALFRRAGRENPGRHTTDYYRGLCAERIDRMEEAIEAYRRCQQNQTHFVPAYVSLGGIYIRQKKIGRAIEQFRKAVNVAPDNMEVKMSMANLLTKHGHPEAAVRIFDEMIRGRHGRNANTLTRRGAARLAAGDRAGAREDWEAAIDLDPNFRPARQKLRITFGVDVDRENRTE